MKVISLNMNGIRAAERKGFYEWLQSQDADIVCLQETRIQEHQLTEKMLKPKGFMSYFNCAEKPGYSGVAIYCKNKPTRVYVGLGWEPFDKEGRMLRVDYGQL
ncbi:MAG: exodeoxyribonuclease III, partial [Planctomycetota bacterium]|nr:exodeoxyribonuclease III [Planctomycetota bacterium]